MRTETAKYARPERERRFLLAEVPGEATDPHEILDLYLVGTRMRLRSVTTTDGVVYKLGHKVRPTRDDPGLVMHTSFYLSREEYDVLAVLPAQRLGKTRRRATLGGVPVSVDQFQGALEGLILAELDLEDRGRTGQSLALPSSCVAEVSHDERFTGGRLAVTDRATMLRVVHEVSGLHLPERAAPASPGDVTLASYQLAAQRYRDAMTPNPVTLVAFLDRFAQLVGPGSVLELGSGVGQDADYLESMGLHVTRTDATPAFLEMMRADGHEARRLDVRTDDLGGGYDAVLADAMLLHLTREEFAVVLGKARRSVKDDGVLAFTLKEGDGEVWTNVKLGAPRHFTFWRAPAVVEALERAGWSPLSVQHVDGAREPWLLVLARAAPTAAPSQ